MTIHHDCDAKGCYVKTRLPDFGCIEDCFEGKVRPSDLDLVVERKGHVLIVECKGPDAPLPTGQRILLEQLSRKPNVQVIVVTLARDGDLTSLYATRLCRNGRWLDEHEGTFEGFREGLRRWDSRARGIRD